MATRLLGDDALAVVAPTAMSEGAPPAGITVLRWGEARWILESFGGTQHLSATSR